MSNRKIDHIGKFGETLDFYFHLEDGWCYPQVELNGNMGTSATLHGQHMTPDEIEALGKALVKYAESQRQSVSPV